MTWPTLKGRPNPVGHPPRKQPPEASNTSSASLGNMQQREQDGYLSFLLSVRVCGAASTCAKATMNTCAHKHCNTHRRTGAAIRPNPQ
eukprot:2407812-Alexandrium_andersonii.AAC.1